MDGLWRGHGWVRPLPGGVKARCGGPAICPRCALEAQQVGGQSRAQAAVSKRTTLSREDYCALGQIVSEMHPLWPSDHKFEVTDTQQIQLGKGVI